MAAKKEFYIRIKDELVEVTQEVYLTYYRGKRDEETQLEKKYAATMSCRMMHSTQKAPSAQKC